MNILYQNENVRKILPKNKFFNLIKPIIKGSDINNKNLTVTIYLKNKRKNENWCKACFSYFKDFPEYGYIILEINSQIPPMTIFHSFAHEFYHWMKFKNGELDIKNRKEIEKDAEIFANELLEENYGYRAYCSKEDYMEDLFFGRISLYEWGVPMDVEKLETDEMCMHKDEDK